MTYVVDPIDQRNLYIRLYIFGGRTWCKGSKWL